MTPIPEAEAVASRFTFYDSLSLLTESRMKMRLGDLIAGTDGRLLKIGDFSGHWTLSGGLEDFPGQ